MRWFFAIELLLSLVPSIGFIVVMRRPRDHGDPGMARFLIATGWQALSVDAVLFAATLGILGTGAATWLLGLALAFQAAVFWWRFGLAWQAQRLTKGGPRGHVEVLEADHRADG